SALHPSGRRRRRRGSLARAAPGQRPGGHPPRGGGGGGGGRGAGAAAGAGAGVVARGRERLGDTAWVTTRDEMVASGWFGAVRPEVLPRIGDVLALMLTDVAVVDTVRVRPAAVRLV